MGLPLITPPLSPSRMLSPPPLLSTPTPSPPPPPRSSPLLPSLPTLSRVLSPLTPRLLPLLLSPLTTPLPSPSPPPPLSSMSATTSTTQYSTCLRSLSRRPLGEMVQSFFHPSWTSWRCVTVSTRSPNI